jgi:hypothetical protein
MVILVSTLPLLVAVQVLGAFLAVIYYFDATTKDIEGDCVSRFAPSQRQDVSFMNEEHWCCGVTRRDIGLTTEVIAVLTLLAGCWEVRKTPSTNYASRIHEFNERLYSCIRGEF